MELIPTSYLQPKSICFWSVLPSKIRLIIHVNSIQIGGGGYGGESNIAGSSGFFLSETIPFWGNVNVSFSVTVGGGGSVNSSSQNSQKLFYN